MLLDLNLNISVITLRVKGLKHQLRETIRLERKIHLYAQYNTRCLCLIFPEDRAQSKTSVQFQCAGVKDMDSDSEKEGK